MTQFLKKEKKYFSKPSPNQGCVVAVSFQAFLKYL